MNSRNTAPPHLELREIPNTPDNPMARTAFCLINDVTFGEPLNDREAYWHMLDVRIPPRVVIGQIGEEVISSAQFSIGNSELEIPAILRSLAVSREAQLHGFGAQTVGFVERLTAETANQIELESSMNAIPFYLRLGYRQKYVRNNYDLIKDLY
jgi:GNAT superfamily N-acetyltransferase